MVEPYFGKLLLGAFINTCSIKSDCTGCRSQYTEAGRIPPCDETEENTCPDLEPDETTLMPENSLALQIAVEIELLGGEIVRWLRQDTIREYTPEQKESLLNKIVFARVKIREYSSRLQKVPPVKEF